MVSDNCCRNFFAGLVQGGCTGYVTGCYHNGKKKTRSESYIFVTVLEISSPVSVNAKMGFYKFGNRWDKSRKREGRDGIFFHSFHP
jgi:hypothetical protein